MKNENNLEDRKQSFFGLSRRGLAGLPYNVRHKSLKQEPFVLNFLQIFYIHSLHPCSHSNVPLSFPNIEPSVFWSTEMTANPNQHWGRENHSSVSRFMTSIVVQLPGSFFLLLGLNEARNSLHFSPLVSKKTSDIQAGGWHDSLERRFHRVEARWRFASFACT